MLSMVSRVVQGVLGSTLSFEKTPNESSRLWMMGKGLYGQSFTTKEKIFWKTIADIEMT